MNPESQIPYVAHGLPAPSHNLGTMKDWQKRLNDHIKSGIGRAAVAGKLGRSTPAIGHWITGHNNINLDEFLKLCEASEADPRYILFGEMTVEVAQRTINEALKKPPKLVSVGQTPTRLTDDVPQYPRRLRERAKRRKIARK